jgi:hypothetical protein
MPSRIPAVLPLCKALRAVKTSRDLNFPATTSHNCALRIIADVLGGILAVEADLVQGPPRTGLRGTLEQRFELGGRERDQPSAIWLLVHGNFRRRLVNDHKRP